MTTPLKSDPRDELLSEEQQFIQLMQGFGIDWKQTRDDYEAKYGKCHFHGWKEAVKLPLARDFINTPLQFYDCTQSQWSDIPPQYFVAYFREHKTARENFADSEKQLMKTLGPGIRQDVSNCLSREWQHGTFGTKLFAWPPESQPKWLRDSAYPGEQNPGSEGATMIAIESRFAYIFPDPSLTWIADGLTGKSSSAGYKICQLDKIYKTGRAYPNARRSRRNPVVLKTAIQPEQIVAWMTPDHLGISHREFSYFFDRDPENKITLERIQPAKGAGGSNISIRDRKSDPQQPYESWATVIEHPQVDGLDSLAKELGEFFAVPVEQFESVDC